MHGRNGWLCNLREAVVPRKPEARVNFAPLFTLLVLVLQPWLLSPGYVPPSHAAWSVSPSSPPPSLISFFQPVFARTITTSADTTQLQDTITDKSLPFTVKLHEDSFRTYKCDPPSLQVQVQKDQLLKMYKDMQTMRRMEMAADTLYKAKLIRGFCHLAIGQARSSSSSWPLAHLVLGSCICWPRTWNHS